MSSSITTKFDALFRAQRASEPRSANFLVEKRSARTARIQSRYTQHQRVTLVLAPRVAPKRVKLKATRCQRSVKIPPISWSANLSPVTSRAPTPCLAVNVRGSSLDGVGSATFVSATG
jgi:hypothetical protein